MALILYRIGRFSFRHPWRVLLTWLALLAAALGAGLAAGGTMQESFEIPGTQSQAALDRLSAVFPEAAGASASIIVLAPAGETVDSDAARAAIEESTRLLGEVDGVTQAVSPFSEYATDAVSEDGRAAIIRAQFEGTEETVGEEQLQAIQDAAAPATEEGLEAFFGGRMFEELEYGLTITEALGVLFAAVVLFITFGSVLAAGLPLASALVAVGTTMGGVLVVAALTPVSSATPLLAVMIGLAVGIDYALFVLSRHRHQLANGFDVEESAATAVGTAGSAVLFAGVTVMIALLGLLVVGIPFLSVMGIAAAIAVFLAMIVAVTLLPALFGLAGERLRPKPGSRAQLRETGQTAGVPLGRRWVRTVLRAPWAFLAGVVAVLGVIALPALDLQLALPSGGGQQPGTIARDAYDATSEHFGEGANGPLLVMLDITQADNDSLLDDLESISERVAAVPGVKIAGDALPNTTVDSAIIQVIPETGPDDPATYELVGALRELGPRIQDEYGVELSVTGSTAVAIDISNRLGDSLLPFAGVVVGLSFILLLLVFRSVLVPLKAAFSFLLSVFAAFGVTVAVFQWGWFSDAMHVVPGPIISFMPIILMAIVFGLAMDYEVFLVSGMREAYVLGASPRQAVEQGFAQGARVVTAAALIMFFVFVAFVPEGAGVIKSIALGLAVGIAFDAFLVRMTLVPALMAILGRSAWWLPRWLRRGLPELDIEGEQLRHYRADAQWARSEGAGLALAASELIAGDARLPVGPITVQLPAGGVLLVEGQAPARHVLAATLAGRLTPAGGRVQIHGHPLPGDAGQVRRHVVLVELGELRDREAELTIAELLRERLRRVGGDDGDDAVNERIRALEAVLAALGAPDPRIPADATITLLDPVTRALGLAQLALAEEPAVLVADTGGLAAGPEGAAVVAILVEGLAALASADSNGLGRSSRDSAASVQRPPAAGPAVVLGVPAGLDLTETSRRLAASGRHLERLQLQNGTPASGTHAVPASATTLEQATTFEQESAR